MTNIGLPVPRGFKLQQACTKYYADNMVIADEIVNEIFEKLAELENKTGKKMGCK